MSTLLYLLGGAMVLHAAYSSMEFHQLAKSMHHEATATKVPTDIIHETVYGIVLIIVGAIRSIKNEVAYTVEGAEVPDGALKDINVNVTVKPDDEFLKPIEMKSAVKFVEKVGLNDYAALEGRVDFVDIVAKRREYNEWLKNQ